MFTKHKRPNFKKCYTVKAPMDRETIVHPKTQMHKQVVATNHNFHSILRVNEESMS